jgi:hypothetical protein
MRKFKLGQLRAGIFPAFPKKKCHRLVRTYLKNRTLIKTKRCQICDEKKYLVGHHSDYSKPLQVIWICLHCHAKIHPITILWKKKISNSLKGKKNAKGCIRTEQFKKHLSEIFKGRKSPMKGKHHTEKSKKLISLYWKKRRENASI